jgi:hypothetical protein
LSAGGAAVRELLPSFEGGASDSQPALITWDDGPMTPEVALPRIAVVTASMAAMEGGGSALRLRVRNGSNALLTGLTADVELEGRHWAALGFAAGTPIRPNEEGELIALLDDGSTTAGTPDVTPVAAALAPFDRKAEFERGLDTWLAN